MLEVLPIKAKLENSYFLKNLSMISQEIERNDFMKFLTFRFKFNRFIIIIINLLNAAFFAKTSKDIEFSKMSIKIN